MQTADPANLFRADADVALEDARKAKAERLRGLGSPIELPSKPLAMAVRDDSAWTAESGGVLRRTDLETGKTLQLYRGHLGPVTCMAFVDNFVFTGSWDKSIKVWDTTTKELLSTTPAHRDFVKSLLVIPSLRLLASGSSDKTVRFWDLSEPNWFNAPLKSLGSISAHTRPVECLAADEDSFACIRMFSADSMGKIKVWSLERRYGPSANCRGSLESELAGHRTGINDMWYGSGIVWTASTDCSVLLQAYPKPRTPLVISPAIPHAGAVRCLLPLPLTELRQSYIITGSGDVIRAYDVSSLEKPELLGEIDAHAHDITGLAYWIRKVATPTGKVKCEVWIVSASLDCTLRKWKLSDELLKHDTTNTKQSQQPKAQAPAPKQTPKSAIELTADEERELAELLSASGSSSEDDDEEENEDEAAKTTDVGAHGLHEAPAAGPAVTLATGRDVHPTATTTASASATA